MGMLRSLLYDYRQSIGPAEAKGAVRPVTADARSPTWDSTATCVSVFQRTTALGSVRIKRAAAVPFTTTT